MVEHVAPADDPVAEPVAAAAAVENLLVVDGIVWTPSDIITADHFDGNVLVLSFLKYLIFGGQQLRSPSRGDEYVRR